MTTVTIIGAGLAGTALAIALHQQSIACRIYESRPSNAPEIPSGVVITPNGLHVVEKLGVLSRIKDKCWQSEFRTYKNDRDETVSKTVIANESLYGYKNHRLWRRLLLREMRTMLAEFGVPIIYDSKFEGIIQDSEDAGVRFSINGREESAALLVGADGIYSSVRKYLQPDAAPEYTGVLGLISHIQRSEVKWPYEDYEKACTIQGKPGALFFIPEVADGSEIMVGTQVQHPDQSRAEWEQMSTDKDKLTGFFRKGYDDWNETAKSLIDAVCAAKDSFFLWPFMRMPALESWSSTSQRVILVGDAAHALPPSSGQGVNQALEDVNSLGLLLETCDIANTTGKNVKLEEVLRVWQKKRQERINQIFDWATNVTNVARMSNEERQQMIKEGRLKESAAGHEDDMKWLYQPVLDEQILSWRES